MFCQIGNKFSLDRSDTEMVPGSKGIKQIYGGHMIAQSIKAATETVNASSYMHNFHCNFVAPGIFFDFF
jgi:acyl-CoA thioesterase